LHAVGQNILLEDSQDLLGGNPLLWERFVKHCHQLPNGSAGGDLSLLKRRGMFRDYSGYFPAQLSMLLANVTQCRVIFHY
jgi:hypothetical protein